MNQVEITRIIEATLARGNKTPGLFDLPKILGIKAKLQSCHSVANVIEIIEEHRSQIIKAFGLNKEAIDSAVEKIKASEP